MARSWNWRKAWAGWTLPVDRGPRGRAFHAYDINDIAACDERVGLSASCEAPNESSHFCPKCMDYVRAHPEGRPKWVIECHEQAAS